MNPDRAQFGHGTYSGWPFEKKAIETSDFLFIRGYGTEGVPSKDTSPLASFVSTGDGELDGGVAADVVVASNRTNGEADAFAARSHPGTAGKGGVAIQGHVLIDEGKDGVSATGFPMWLSSQLFTKTDMVSSEINTVNCTGINPPGDGEYGTMPFLNALALIAKGPNESSSALVIDGDGAPFQRGIDFTPDSVSHYTMVLPNGKPIVARTEDNQGKFEVLTPIGLSLRISAMSRILFEIAGVMVAYIDKDGFHAVNPTVAKI